MNKEFVTDVLICGAGAAGLTLALDLARRGVAFRLIERQATPFQGSRGKGIQPRTQEIFEDLEILDRVAAVGGPYPPQLRQHRPDGGYEELPMPEQREPTPAEPYGQALMVRQCATEAVMRQKLLELGHRVEFNTRLEALSQDADGVAATVARPDGAAIWRVRYLVGADGGGSAVRKLLDLGFPGKTLGVRAIVADVALTGLDRDAWHRFNHTSAERQISICPLAGTDLFQVQAPVPLEGEVDLSAHGIAAMVAERSGRDDIRIHSVSWASAYSMNARLAERYRVGRIFLAGDAAHIHPPTGGQGLNTSIQDSYNLGWKLAAVLAGAGKALLDTYEEERRPIAAEVLGLSTQLLEAAKHGDMRRGRAVRQLDLGYPESALSLGQPRRTLGLLAGQRAPDAVVRGAGGQLTRIFALLKGPRWTILGNDISSDAKAALRRAGVGLHEVGTGGDLADVHGQFRAAYALQPGELALVRPDGYIGAIVDATGIDALERYMRGVGLQMPEPALA